MILTAGVSPAKPLYQPDRETFSIDWNADVRASFLLANMH